MTASLADVPRLLAVAISAAALGAGALTLLVTRRPSLALAVLLDLLLAAGLLRLGSDPGWQAIAVAAALVGLRRVIGAGLRVGGRSWARAPSAPGPGRSSRADLRQLLTPTWRR
ncbi:hypothetical protein [Modestobacter lapidis]